MFILYRYSEVDYRAMTELRVKTVHLIVHVQRKLLQQVKENLVAKGFKTSRLQPASLKRCERAPKEIVVSEITGTRTSESQNVGVGAWTSISQM